MLGENNLINNSNFCGDENSDCIFIRGVGVVTKADALKELSEEDIGGVYIGKDFSFTDLEALQSDLNHLRREDIASKADLAANDDILIRIERKLRIREALKYQKI